MPGLEDRSRSRGFKKLDIFQSKQKEGFDDDKSDQTEKRVVEFSPGIVHAHVQRNSVELLTTSLYDSRKGV